MRLGWGGCTEYVSQYHEDTLTLLRTHAATCCCVRTKLVGSSGGGADALTTARKAASSSFSRRRAFGSSHRGMSSPHCRRQCPVRSSEVNTCRSQAPVEPSQARRGTSSLAPSHSLRDAPRGACAPRHGAKRRRPSRQSPAAPSLLWQAVAGRGPRRPRSRPPRTRRRRGAL